MHPINGALVRLVQVVQVVLRTISGPCSRVLLSVWAFP